VAKKRPCFLRPAPKDNPPQSKPRYIPDQPVAVKLVAWHLTFRVPLNFAAIPEAEIKAACERFEMSLDTWQRQERAFGLLKKVYTKRAKLRGEQPPIATLKLSKKNQNSFTFAHPLLP
jgi:hypothetical protein